MNLVWLLVIILVILALGGGGSYYGGWHTGFPGGSYGYDGGLGLIVVVFVVLWLIVR